MLTSVTFNPALDVSGTVDRIVPDEKSYVRDEIHTPGGNGINAAIIAHRLGCKVLATGFLGGGAGEEIKSFLDKLKIPHHFVSIQGKTRINLTVNNRDNHRQTRLSFPGPKITAEEKRVLESQLLKSKGLILFGGSLPSGTKANELKSLVQKLKKDGHTCLVDVPGKILAEVIKARPDFIKPNLIEFQELLGTKAQTIKSLMPLIRKLNEKVPLICVSSVEGGALLVSRDEAWFGKIPKVKIMSTVGAGDSMVGAMASCLEKNRNTPLEELLRWGLAASCATLTEKGMTLGKRSSIKSSLALIELRRIR